MYVELTTKTSW